VAVSIVPLFRSLFSQSQPKPQASAPASPVSATTKRHILQARIDAYRERMFPEPVPVPAHKDYRVGSCDPLQRIEGFITFAEECTLPNSANLCNESMMRSGFSFSQNSMRAGESIAGTPVMLLRYRTGSGPTRCIHRT
jgi:hypothetical protein